MPILVIIIVIIYRHIEQPGPNIHDNMADIMVVDIHHVDVDDDRVDMDVEMHDMEVEGAIDVEMPDMEVEVAIDMELDD